MSNDSFISGPPPEWKRFETREEGHPKYDDEKKKITKKGFAKSEWIKPEKTDEKAGRSDSRMQIRKEVVTTDNMETVIKVQIVKQGKWSRLLSHFGKGSIGKKVISQVSLNLKDAHSIRLIEIDKEGHIQISKALQLFKEKEQKLIKFRKQAVTLKQEIDSYLRENPDFQVTDDRCKILQFKAEAFNKFCNDPHALDNFQTIENNYLYLQNQFTKIKNDFKKTTASELLAKGRSSTAIRSATPSSSSKELSPNQTLLLGQIDKLEQELNQLLAANPDFLNSVIELQATSQGLKQVILSMKPEERNLASIQKELNNLNERKQAIESSSRGVSKPAIAESQTTATTADPLTKYRENGMVFIDSFVIRINQLPDANIKETRLAKWKKLELELKAAKTIEDLQACSKKIEHTGDVDAKIIQALQANPKLSYRTHAFTFITQVGSIAKQAMPSKDQCSDPAKYDHLKDQLDKLERGDLDLTTTSKHLFPQLRQLFPKQTIKQEAFQKWEEAEKEIEINFGVFTSFIQANELYNKKEIERKENEIKRIESGGKTNNLLDACKFDLDQFRKKSKFNPQAPLISLKDQPLPETSTEVLSQIEEFSENLGRREDATKGAIQQISHLKESGAHVEAEQLERDTTEQLVILPEAQNELSLETIADGTTVVQQQTAMIDQLTAESTTVDTVILSVKGKIEAFQQELKTKYLDSLKTPSNVIPAVSSEVQKKVRGLELYLRPTRMEEWAKLISQNPNQKFQDLTPSQMKEYEILVDQKIQQSRQEIEKGSFLKEMKEANILFEKSLSDAKDKSNQLKDNPYLSNLLDLAIEKAETLLTQSDNASATINDLIKSRKKLSVDLQAVLTEVKKAEALTEAKQLELMIKLFPTHEKTTELYDQYIQKKVDQGLKELDDYIKKFDALPDEMSKNQNLKEAFNFDPLFLTIRIHFETVKELQELRNNPLQANTEVTRAIRLADNLSKILEDKFHLNGIIEAKQSFESQKNQILQKIQELEADKHISLAEELKLQLKQAEDQYNQAISVSKSVTQESGKLNFKTFKEIADKMQNATKQLTKALYQVLDTTEKIEARDIQYKLYAQLQHQIEDEERNLKELYDKVFKSKNLSLEFRNKMFALIKAKSKDLASIQSESAKITSFEDLKKFYEDNVKKITLALEDIESQTHIQAFMTHWEQYGIQKEKLADLSLQDTAQAAKADRILEATNKYDPFPTLSLSINDIPQMKKTIKLLEKTTKRLEAIYNKYNDADESAVQQLSYFEKKYGENAAKHVVYTSKSGQEFGYQSTRQAVKANLLNTIQNYRDKLKSQLEEARKHSGTKELENEIVIALDKLNNNFTSDFEMTRGLIPGLRHTESVNFETANARDFKAYQNRLHHFIVEETAKIQELANAAKINI